MPVWATIVWPLHEALDGTLGGSDDDVDRRVARAIAGAHEPGADERDGEEFGHGVSLGWRTVRRGSEWEAMRRGSRWFWRHATALTGRKICRGCANCRRGTRRRPETFGPASSRAAASEMRARSLQIEPILLSKSLFCRMILSEESATFRDRARAGPKIATPGATRRRPSTFLLRSRTEAMKRHERSGPRQAEAQPGRSGDLPERREPARTSAPIAADRARSTPRPARPAAAPARWSRASAAARA